MNTPFHSKSVKILLLGILCLVTVSSFEGPAKTLNEKKPKLCLTFDDGNPVDMPGYSWQQWNDLLLHHLQEQQL